VCVCECVACVCYCVVYRVLLCSVSCMRCVCVVRCEKSSFLHFCRNAFFICNSTINKPTMLFGNLFIAFFDPHTHTHAKMPKKQKKKLSVLGT